VKGLMQDPQELADGLRAEQAEAERGNSVLRSRLEIIDKRLTDTRAQLVRLLDLYLQGDFSKEMLTERKAQLEKDVIDLAQKRVELSVHPQDIGVTDEQIAAIETFCADMREGLDSATFEDKRRYFELLDVRGKLAVEDGEKVIYIKCKLGEQRLLQIQTLPSSNTGVIAMMPCVCLPIPRFR
jgi:hypothetical protein